MTRQQILAVLRSAGIPSYAVSSLSTLDLVKYCEGPARDRVKQVEAGRLRAWVERNRSHFAAMGQSTNAVVKAFKAGPECFAEVFSEGRIGLDEADLSKGPDHQSTGDEADKPERKVLRQTSLDKNKKSALTREEKLAKHREKIKLKRWAEQNRRELESYGTTPEKVVNAFASDDSFTRCSQFIGK